MIGCDTHPIHCGIYPRDRLGFHLMDLHTRGTWWSFVGSSFGK